MFRFNLNRLYSALHRFEGASHVYGDIHTQANIGVVYGDVNINDNATVRKF